MPGILTHLSIALIGSLLFGFLFKSYKYGLAFVIGHLIPDITDFGVLTLVTGHFDYYKIMQHPWFAPLSIFGHNFFNWMIIAIIVFAISFLLYHFKKMSKKTLVFAGILLAIFLVGVGIHVILDALIIEKNYWI